MGLMESKWADAAVMQNEKFAGICCEEQRKSQKAFQNRKSFAVDQSSVIASFCTPHLQKSRERSNSFDGSIKSPFSETETIDALDFGKQDCESRFKFRMDRNFARSCDSLAMENELSDWKFEERMSLEASIITASQKMNVKPPSYIDHQVLQQS